MNTHANELKNCLLKIIDEMALSSDIFNLSGKPAFCRKSKFNFSTLIQFIPVSYTHLDVYKRQSHRRDSKTDSGAWMCVPRSVHGDVKA